MDKLKLIWDYLLDLPPCHQPLDVLSSNYKYLYRYRDSKTNLMKLKVLAASNDGWKISIIAQFENPDGLAFIVRHRSYIIDTDNVNQFFLNEGNMELLYDKT